MKANVKLGRHFFNFSSPKENSGESLSITTDFYSNGDPDGIYVNQEITLHSYCNHASIHLFGASLMPNNLRELADQLEKAMAEAKEKAR